MARRQSYANPRPPAACRAPSEVVSGVLLRVVDGGLAGCLLVVPLLMGGRSALGQIVLVMLAVAVALSWTVWRCLAARRAWRWSGAELLLAGGLALLVVQLVPLPQPVLGWLAPHTAEILPLWAPDADPSAGLGAWSQISLTPADTRDGLVLFLAYGLLFLVTVQRVRAVEDAERLLRWCAWSAVLMAAFGLAQLLTSNGKFFWVYEHPFTSTAGVAKGSFTNRNHFAHFLALGIGPLIWWIQHSPSRRGQRRQKGFGRPRAELELLGLGKSLRVIALGLVLLAVLLSLSRGGIAVALLAAAICAAVCWRRSSKGTRLAASLAGVGLLVGLSLAIFGYDRVSARLDTLVSGSLEKIDSGVAQRRTIWKTVAKAVPDFAAVGSGVGSHREVYPMYLPHRQSDKYFSHAECGYLQVTLEAGLSGLTLLLGGIGLCVFWCVAGLRSAGSDRIVVCLGAVSASLAASAVHSLVDFVWYVPACMALVAVLAACACRLWQLARQNQGGRVRELAFSRLAAALAAIVLLLAGAWMIASRIGPAVAERHWDRFLLLNEDSADLPLMAADPAGQISREKSDALLSADRSMITELQRVVDWDPNHAEAHLRLARAYLRLFHDIQQSPEFAEVSGNVMPLGQIRDTVIRNRSYFPSREAFDEWLAGWLPKAIGPHCRYLSLALEHTRRGLRLCPLWGEGYLYLAELCFLEGASAETWSGYVGQALRVRPFDGTVLFYAGHEAGLSGDRECWAHYWRQAFHSGPTYRRQIIDTMVGRTPLEPDQEIRSFLQTFQPDYDGLKLLYDRYREIARSDQIALLQKAYARAAEVKAKNAQGEEAAVYWLDAMGLYKDLNDPDRRLRCGRKALECAPSSYRVRHRLAFCLDDLGRFADAEVHFRWLLKRNPHPSLERKLREVIKSRMRGGPPPPAPSAIGSRPDSQEIPTRR